MDFIVFMLVLAYGLLSLVSNQDLPVTWIMPIFCGGALCLEPYHHLDPTNRRNHNTGAASIHKPLRIQLVVTAQEVG